jgi:phosphotransferase system HPr (HPr) family protein
MRTIDKTVLNPSGIHLRPAAVFVKAAAGFASRITLENLTLAKAPVDAKSMIGVMTAGSRQGHQVRIAADGPDEDAALAALEALIDSGLGEALPG